MKLMNTSKKIINIGELALTPGATDTIPADFKNNPVVAFLMEHGKLVLVPPEPNEDGPESPYTPEVEHTLKVESVKKMKRAELDAACIDAGIPVDGGDTMPTLQEKLIAKLLEM